MLTYCGIDLENYLTLQVKEYVSTRVGLQQVCLLIDTKWGMKPRDHELIDLMERCDEFSHLNSSFLIVHKCIKFSHLNSWLL